MYKMLIRKIRQDNTLTKEEKERRCANVIDFWAKEGDGYVRLLKKIKKEDDVSFDNFFRYLGYWFRFKLLCDGKELTIDNLIENKFNIYELNLFMSNVIDMINN